MPTSAKAKAERIGPVVDRLFWDLKRERDLLAQAKDISGQLRAVRRSLTLGIADLRSRSGHPDDKGFEKTDYICGCIVVCGQLWRNCKTEMVRAGPGRAAYPYEFEANAKARQEGRRIPHPEFDEKGQRIPPAKVPCERKKKET